MHQNQWQDLWEQITIFFVKYIPIPALIAIFIKISVQVKRKTATWLGSLVSLFIGVGVASLANAFVKQHTSENLYPIAIGFIAIMSEKTIEYLMFKADVDKALSAIGNSITDWIKRKFK
jgi:uncharacterized membrane protein YczE